MKMKDLEFNNQLEISKINQISKYKDFDIPKDILDKTFEEASKKFIEENEVTKEHDRLVQKYIVDEINNGNSVLMGKVIDSFTSIKTIILKNKRYELPRDVINSIYIKAIKLLKYKYNDEVSINMNILNNMKYIINNNYIDTPINKMDIQIYDISFIRRYIKEMKIDPNKFANELEITNRELSLLLNGEKKATIDLMETICIYFDVENYEELIQKLEVEIKSKRINVEEIREKLKEEPKHGRKIVYKVKKDEKYYNLSFMKEYVDLYKIRKDTLAELFSCGLNKIDDILNGNIFIKETLMSDLYIEYRVKGFTEFKAKILSYIKVFKLNDLKNKLKAFYDKYKHIQIKEESIINMMPRDLLAEALNLKSMNPTDKGITKLLFKIGFDEDYSYEDIAMVFNVDKEYVINVHRNNLIKITSMLKDTENTNKKVLK